MFEMPKMTTRKLAPSVEYTCPVCTCGKELSSLYYRLTCSDDFNHFADTYRLKHMDDYFTTTEKVTVSSCHTEVSFCCMMNLQYGIKGHISSSSESEQFLKTSSNYKYPHGLPGPLSKEKILTWV
jgi:hypothetical protein